MPSVYSSALRTSTLSASATAFASFSFTSACVLPRTLLMIRLPFFHRIQRYIALPIAHPCAFEYCPRRLPVSLPCSCLLRFGSTNNYHRTGTKSTDFFGRSEYFSAGFLCVGNPYSLFIAAQFLHRSVSIFILDFFAVCFIMVLCKLSFAWICKKNRKATNTCVKATDFWFTKIVVSHKIRRENRALPGRPFPIHRKWSHGNRSFCKSGVHELG